MGCAAATSRSVPVRSRIGGTTRVRVPGLAGPSARLAKLHSLIPIVLELLHCRWTATLESWQHSAWRRVHESDSMSCRLGSLTMKRMLDREPIARPSPSKIQPSSPRTSVSVGISHGALRRQDPGRTSFSARPYIRNLSRWIALELAGGHHESHTLQICAALRATSLFGNTI